jgi:hypothetical protein
VPLARWCGAVRVFARGAEPLAGNCCLVAGQWLSLSGKYRQPVNITVPRYWAGSRFHDTQPSVIFAAATPAEIPRKATIRRLLKDFRLNRQIPRQIIVGACNEEHHPAAQLIGHAYHPGTNKAAIVRGGSRSLCRERTLPIVGGHWLRRMPPALMGGLEVARGCDALFVRSRTGEVGIDRVMR